MPDFIELEDGTGNIGLEDDTGAILLESSSDRLYWHNFFGDNGGGKRDNFTIDAAGTTPARDPDRDFLEDFNLTLLAQRGYTNRGYFRMSDTTATVSDDSGNGWNGSLVGGYTQGETGPVRDELLTTLPGANTATLFDGTTGYADMSSFAANMFNGIGNSATINFGMRLQSLPLGSYGTIFHAGSNALNEIWIRVRSDGVLEVLVSDGTDWTEAVCNTLVVGTDYFVTVRILGGTGTDISVSVNGVEVGTASSVNLIDLGAFSGGSFGACLPASIPSEAVSPPSVINPANTFLAFTLHSFVAFAGYLEDALVGHLSTIAFFSFQQAWKPNFRYYRLRVPAKEAGGLASRVDNLRFIHNSSPDTQELYPPDMTANNAPAPYVASNYRGDSDAYEAFDNDVGSNCTVAGNMEEGWVKIDMGAQQRIDGFEVDWAGGNGRAARYFVLEGSNNDSDWKAIATDLRVIDNDVGATVYSIDDKWNDELDFSNGTGPGRSDSWSVTADVTCQIIIYDGNADCPWTLPAGQYLNLIGISGQSEIDEPQVFDGALAWTSDHTVVSQHAGSGGSGEFVTDGRFTHQRFGDTTYGPVFKFIGFSASLDANNGEIRGNFRSVAPGDSAIGFTVESSGEYVRETQAPNSTELGFVNVDGGRFRIDTFADSQQDPTGRVAAVVRVTDGDAWIRTSNNGPANFNQRFEFYGTSCNYFNDRGNNASHDISVDWFVDTGCTLVFNMDDGKNPMHFTDPLDLAGTQPTLKALGATGDFDIEVRGNSALYFNPGLTNVVPEHGDTLIDSGISWDPGAQDSGCLVGWLFDQPSESTGNKVLSFGTGTITFTGEGGMFRSGHYQSDSGYDETPNNSLQTTNDFVIDANGGFEVGRSAGGNPVSWFLGDIEWNSGRLRGDSGSGGNGQAHRFQGTITVKNNNGVLTEYLWHLNMGNNQGIVFDESMVRGPGSDGSNVVLRCAGAQTNEHFYIANNFMSVAGPDYPELVIRNVELSIRTVDAGRHCPKMLFESTSTFRGDVSGFWTFEGLFFAEEGAAGEYSGGSNRHMRLTNPGPHEMYLTWNVSHINESNDVKLYLADGVVIDFGTGRDIPAIEFEGDVEVQTNAPKALGAVAWFDATDQSTITTDANGVTAWQDKISGTTITQNNDPKKPDYVTGEYVEFDGVDDYLGVMDRFGLAGDPDIMVIIAAEVEASTSTDSTRIWQIGGTNGNAAEAGILAGSVSDDGIGWRYNGGNAVFDFPYVTDQRVVSWTRSAGDSVSDSELFWEGTEIPSTSSTGDAPDSVDVSFTLGAGAFSGGGVGTTPDNWTPCKIREFIVFDVNDNSIRQKIEAYLAQKYRKAGITVPASHPAPSLVQGGDSSVIGSRVNGGFTATLDRPVRLLSRDNILYEGTGFFTFVGEGEKAFTLPNNTTLIDYNLCRFDCDVRISGRDTTCNVDITDHVFGGELTFNNNNVNLLPVVTNSVITESITLETNFSGGTGEVGLSFVGEVTAGGFRHPFAGNPAVDHTITVGDGNTLVMTGDIDFTEISYPNMTWDFQGSSRLVAVNDTELNFGDGTVSNPTREQVIEFRFDSVPGTTDLTQPFSYEYNYTGNGTYVAAWPVQQVYNLTWRVSAGGDLDVNEFASPATFRVDGTLSAVKDAGGTVDVTFFGFNTTLEIGYTVDLTNFDSFSTGVGFELVMLGIEFSDPDVTSIVFDGKFGGDLRFAPEVVGVPSFTYNINESNATCGDLIFDRNGAAGAIMTINIVGKLTVDGTVTSVAGSSLVVPQVTGELEFNGDFTPTDLDVIVYGGSSVLRVYTDDTVDNNVSVLPMGSVQNFEVRPDQGTVQVFYQPGVIAGDDTIRGNLNLLDGAAGTAVTFVTSGDMFFEDNFVIGSGANTVWTIDFGGWDWHVQGDVVDFSNLDTALNPDTSILRFDGTQDVTLSSRAGLRLPHLYAQLTGELSTLTDIEAASYNQNANGGTVVNWGTSTVTVDTLSASLGSWDLTTLEATFVTNSWFVANLDLSADNTWFVTSVNPPVYGGSFLRNSDASGGATGQAYDANDLGGNINWDFNQNDNNLFVDYDHTLRLGLGLNRYGATL